MFHYILQGLVTNELAGSDYHLDLGKVLGEVNVDNIFAFDSGNASESLQLSSILSLVTESDGTNPESGKLPSLIDCSLKSGCFADGEESLSNSFLGCYIFNGFLKSPPCEDEFGGVMETVNWTEVVKCFEDVDVVDEVPTRGLLSPISAMEPFENNPLPTNNRHLFIPDGVTDEGISDLDDDSKLDLVLCLASAALPKDATNKIMDTINDLLGIAGFVFEVIENGINIPG